MLVVDVDRVGIDRRDRRHRLEVAGVGGGSLRVDHRVVREHDVISGERLVVVPAHVASELEREVQTVAAELPGLGQLRHEVDVFVVLDQAVVDQRADLDRGAGAGAGSRTTELARSPPRIASVNDVIVKTTAMPVVILPSSVGVPIDPNTAWLPAPPNAEPMSAPLPDCSRTIPMMAKHARTCR